jgi:AraC-like DNA-binding protein
VRNRSEPLTRASSLAGFSELVRKLDGDPVSLLKQASLGTSVLIDPDLRVESRKISRVLELAAIETGCEDFGLRLANMHGLGTLGPIGMLAREEATVGDALKTLVDYVYLHVSVAHLALHRAGGTAVLAISMLPGLGTHVRQAREMMAGATVGVLRSFLGDRWNPAGVQFTHTAPRKRDFHRRFFRCGIEFEQAITAVLIDSDDLRRPIAPANPEFQRYARQWVDALAAQATSEQPLADDVRRLVPLLLSAGKCSADKLAEYLRQDRRTIHRKLQLTGTSFSVLVNEVRRELAETSVAESTRSLGDIADMLGFAHLSGFSRWFTSEFGVNPSTWRARSSRRD